jgi:hypothetical protein
MPRSVKTSFQTGLQSRVCKSLRNPGIDSAILCSYIGWRNRFLGYLNVYKFGFSSLPFCADLLIIKSIKTLILGFQIFKLTFNNFYDHNLKLHMKFSKIRRKFLTILNTSVAIMPCVVKSSFKTGLQISLQRSILTL